MRLFKFIFCRRCINRACELNEVKPLVVGRFFYSKFSQAVTLSFLICNIPYKTATPTNPITDCPIPIPMLKLIINTIILDTMNPQNPIFFHCKSITAKITFTTPNTPSNTIIVFEAFCKLFVMKSLANKYVIAVKEFSIIIITNQAVTHPCLCFCAVTLPLSFKLSIPMLYFLISPTHLVFRTYRVFNGLCLHCTIVPFLNNILKHNYLLLISPPLSAFGFSVSHCAVSPKGFRRIAQIYAHSTTLSHASGMVSSIMATARKDKNIKLI